MRDSNFELLRIVAMFSIICYHLLSFFIFPESNLPFYRAIQIPLHVGVVLFVLISGYYGIRVSLRGLLKLLLPILFFYVPVELAVSVKDCKVGEVFNSLMFVSGSPYWFVRTYIWLFLLSPVVNWYLKDISLNRRIYLIFSLCVMAVYFGTVKGDASLEHGTNVVNFVFLYVLGNTVACYRKFIFKFNYGHILFYYLSLNIVIVIVYVLFANTIISSVIIKTCFHYCSPILIFNSLLLFVIFDRIHFNSNVVNIFASSTFSMYIIHHIPLLLYGIIGPLTLKLCPLDNIPITLLLLSVITIGIMIVSFVIDQSFKPLFDWIISRAVNSKYSPDKYFKIANIE